MALVPHRLLIVDDDPDVRWMLETRFEHEPDIELLPSAGNGLEALGLVGAYLPDAVVLDLEMPLMDGARAIPDLRRLAPAMGIVVYSSSGRAGELCGDAMPDAVVPKGSPLTELVNTVRTVVGRVAGQGMPGRVVHRTTGEEDVLGTAAVPEATA